MRPTAFGVVLLGGAVSAGAGALFLCQYLYRHRSRAGATWFMCNIATVAVFCLVYSVAWLVFDPMVREALEMSTFVLLGWMGPTFLAFGLDYTGRADLIRTAPFGLVAGVSVASVGIAVTNGVHGLVWTNLEQSTVFGLSTMTYSYGPWGVFTILFSVGTATVGSLLLIGAILSYGPLYRREGVAVTLSTVPPIVGVLLWLFGLGPEVHLTATLLFAHISLDGYAFVGTHMFETNPATQRAAELSGLDTLSEPVLVLDTNEQLVKVNESAETVFPGTDVAALPVDVESVTGVGLTDLRASEELEVPGPTGGTYAVSYTPLSDPNDEPVGGMVVLYDLTETQQREQRLSVLNRVLRHNLRNELTVIQGFAESLSADLTDEELQQQASTISRAGGRLLSMGEKLREFDRAQDHDANDGAVDLTKALAAVEREFNTRYPEATVETTVSDQAFVRATPDILELALSNLTENALEHAESSAPTVTVRVDTTANKQLTHIEIRDTNPPIPEMEVSVLREGNETPLNHGRGIGLWVVRWCVTALNGEIDYQYDEGNVLTLTVPSAYPDHPHSSRKADGSG